jgi:hypothetical protein
LVLVLSSGSTSSSLLLSDLLNLIMASPTVPPSFERCDVLAALMFASSEAQPISRFTLMTRLDLKEGPVKTLLRRLEQNGLMARVGNRGHTLTNAGKTWNNKIRQRIIDFKEVKVPALSLAKFAYGIQMRNLASLVESGIEQRDRALLVGGAGATTLVFEDGELKIPSVSRKVVDRNTLKDLLSVFKLQEDDILIVGMGHNPGDAQRGAFNAALSLLMKLC